MEKWRFFKTMCAKPILWGVRIFAVGFILFLLMLLESLFFKPFYAFLIFYIYFKYMLLPGLIIILVYYLLKCSKNINKFWQVSKNCYGENLIEQRVFLGLDKGQCPFEEMSNLKCWQGQVNDFKPNITYVAYTHKLVIRNLKKFCTVEYEEIKEKSMLKIFIFSHISRLLRGKRMCATCEDGAKCKYRLARRNFNELNKKHSYCVVRFKRKMNLTV